MEQTDFSEQLKAMLLKDLGAIPNIDLNQRILDVIQAMPQICALAEPWLPWDERQRQCLYACARIHVYSRILDDALDEPEQTCRLNLLSGQELLWSAVWDLALSAPEIGKRAAMLVRETVVAVHADETTSGLACLGAKNHHLLLVPLAMSPDPGIFERIALPLSELIALVQAKDEYIQERSRDIAMYCRIVTQALRNVEFLADFGFHAFCRYACMSCRYLLMEMERND